MRSPICAAALAAAMLTLAGCVTGVDPETRAALRATMESAQELVDLWRERLDVVDGGGSIEIEPIGEVFDLPATATLPAFKYFEEWGYQATNDDATLFKATILASADIVNDFPRNAKYFSIVTGQTAFDSPEETEGSATWSGQVRGVQRADFGAITGDAEIEYDFRFDWVDVRLDAFSDGHRPLIWDAIPVSAGSFTRGTETAPFVPFVEGRFYGAGHEGVAGKFRDGNLRGIFGAVRE